MGKYSDANPRASGYYGRNDAGNLQDFIPKDSGIDREFVGSDSKEYTFQDTIHGTHTITAESYEEAVRIAESMGYKASDYKPRRRRGKK